MSVKLLQPSGGDVSAESAYSQTIMSAMNDLQADVAAITDPYWDVSPVTN